MRFVRWSLPVVCVGLAALGCVEAGAQAPRAAAAKALVPSEVQLPDKAFFQGCVAGAELHGYPIVPGADATYCATITEPASREGAFVAYYPSGKLLAKGAYQRGNPWGPWTTYYENGHILSEGSYFNTVREGGWRFFRADGKPVIEESFAGGKRLGYTEYEYKKGDLVAYETYEMRDGQEVSQGRAGRALPGGDMLEGFYKDGQADGSWVVKSAKGDAVAHLTMAGGFAEGTAASLWPATGKPAATGELVKSLPQGTWHLTYPNGDRRADLVYEKGLLRRVDAYHANGQKALEGALEDGAPSWAWTAFHANGAVRVKGAFAGGLRQGMWRSADEAGKTLAEGMYEGGVLIEGQRVDPVPWTSIGAGEPLDGLFTALGFMTAGRGEVQVGQRAIGECMLLGDPVAKCLSLDWESTPSPHAADGPAEVLRREKQQDLACAMDNPAACARAGKRALAAAADKPAPERKKAVARAAGLYQKACDLSPGETAWKARDATGRALYKGFHSASACVWLGEMLAKGEVTSKAETAGDLFKQACDQGLTEGCDALTEARKAPPKKGVDKASPKAVDKTTPPKK